MRDSKLKLADEGVDDVLGPERLFGPPVSSMDERPGGIGILNPELLVARCEVLETSLEVGFGDLDTTLVASLGGIVGGGGGVVFDFKTL